jgi:hypothetical protein
MGSSEDAPAWRKLGDGALIIHARGEDTADEYLWPGRVCALLLALGSHRLGTGSVDVPRCLRPPTVGNPDA